MKRILLSLFFIGSFFVLSRSFPVEARQDWPNPGVNCGVAYDPLRDYKNSTSTASLNTSTTPNLAVDTQFACCEGKLTEDDVKGFGRIITQTSALPFLENGATDGARLSESIPNQLGVLIPVVGVAKGILSTGENIYNGITSIPLRGLIAISDAMSDTILDFPTSFIPTHPTFLPTVRTLLSSYNGNDKCLAGGLAEFDSNNACYCRVKKSLTSLAKFCNNINREGEQNECLSCLGFEKKPGSPDLIQNGKQAGIWTAIGCIPSDATGFIEKTVFGLAIGFVGLISLLCILYSSFLLQTSAGDPERIKKAQELLTSCIAGLMMVIFSVFILRLIGVTILGIPGFN